MIRKPSASLYSDPQTKSTLTALFRRFNLDLPLLCGLALLGMIGLIVLYSAGGQQMEVIFRQLLRFALGFGVLVVLAQVPPHHFERWAPWLYGLGLILLVAVLAIGTVGKGAQRWLDLGVLRFQPSEIMRIAVPLMVAWWLSDKTLPPPLSRIVVGLVLVILPAALIAKQPDLGTAILVTASGIFVLLLSGVKWRYVFAALSVLPIAAWGMWRVMHDYQRQRILTFLDPETDPLGAGYHIIQSKIAIGSGGLYGKGWLNGTQAYLDYIPERTTDFIFAVMGEEFGLVGVVAVLSIYLFVVLRGLYLASQAQNTHTRLVAGSLILTFSVYMIVNIGMVTGLLPVVGVPLPLISFGGTSLVTVMATFGILMSISSHRKLVSS